jgi:hypothetical protein
MMRMMNNMKRQNVDDYFKMLGEVFEWICYESDDEVELSGVYKEDDRIKEIESSGLFTLVEKIDYLTELYNNADQYLKVMSSVPTFATILDGLDDNSIINMNNEIKAVINDYGGYVKSYLNYSLYITKKVGHNYD